MSSFKDDIFRGSKSLPTFGDLIKVARSRGVGWRDTKGKKKEELANFLNIPLIYNPNYVEPKPPQRPNNDTLRLIAHKHRNYHGVCCHQRRCLRTTILDTNTGEEFRFHTKGGAYAALETESKKLIKSWGFSVEVHSPKVYGTTYGKLRHEWEW